MVNTYRVDGMSCGHCKARVEKALSEIEGISNPVVDLPNGTVTFENNGVAEQVILDAIDEAGYDAEKL